MFRDCIEFQKLRKRLLFSLKVGQSFETNDKFKYPNQVATIIDKGVIPAGFDEKHLIKIKYQHNNEEDVIDCSYVEYWVKVIVIEENKE